MRRRYANRYDSTCCSPSSARRSASAPRASRDLPFRGADVWTAYEASWLDRRQAADRILTFVVPRIRRDSSSRSREALCDGDQPDAFRSAAEVIATIARDLANAVGAPVDGDAEPPREFRRASTSRAGGESLDELSIAVRALRACARVARRARTRR
jgi:7-cyano-7-deazaguanine reductase